MNRDVVYEVKQVRTAVEAALGAEQVQSLSLLGEGMDNIAYLVNERYVFRFPKNDEMAALVEAETAVLQLIQRSVELQVPAPTYFGRIAPTSYPFYAYPLIEGVWLSDLEQTTLSPHDHQQIADSLDTFIRQLHAIPLDHQLLRDVRRNDMRTQYTQDFENLQRLVFPLISAELRSFLQKLWDDYFNNQANFDFQPALLHADLSADHILVDPSTKQVVGVIDFGDVMIADPIYELHWYDAPERPLWQELLLAQNPAYQTHGAPERCRFFHIANFAQDFIDGVEDDFAETIEYGWSNLKRLAQID